jgi:hypothetical protein
MRYLFTVLAGVVFLASCSKDEAANKTQLLTNQVWKYGSGGIDMNNDGTPELTFEALGVPPACALDNTGKFNTNNTGVADEGTVKCDPSSPQTSTFNWSFTNNETAITISGNGFAGLSGTFKIRELTATKFTLSKDTTVGGMLPASLILSLKH